MIRYQLVGDVSCKMILCRVLPRSSAEWSHVINWTNWGETTQLGFAICIDTTTVATLQHLQHDEVFQAFHKPAVNHEMNCPKLTGLSQPLVSYHWAWLVREDAPRRCDTNRREGLKRSSYYFQVGLYSRALFLVDMCHYFSIIIFMML